MIRSVNYPKVGTYYKKSKKDNLYSRLKKKK